MRGQAVRAPGSGSWAGAGDNRVTVWSGPAQRDLAHGEFGRLDHQPQVCASVLRVQETRTFEAKPGRLPTLAADELHRLRATRVGSGEGSRLIAAVELHAQSPGCRVVVFHLQRRAHPVGPFE